MQATCEEDEDLGVEEGEVVEAVLPANDGTHHEQPRTAQDHHDNQDYDLGVGGSRRVWRE